MAKNLWKNPRTEARPDQVTTGSPRSYIPVLSFRSPEQTPVGGIVGKTTQIDGTQRVTFIAGRGGNKAASTHKP